MIPAEFTDRVDDLVHLSQGHPIHLLVEYVEVGFYLLVVVGIIFIVAFVEHGQNGLPIAVVWWMGFDIGFQCFKICFQGNTSQKFWVILPWRVENYK